MATLADGVPIRFAVAGTTCVDDSPIGDFGLVKGGRQTVDVFENGPSIELSLISLRKWGRAYGAQWPSIGHMAVRATSLSRGRVW